MHGELTSTGRITLTAVLCLMLLLMATAAQVATQGPPLTRKDLRFQVNPSSTLSLSNADGAITVRGVAGRQAQVTASLRSSKVEVDSLQSGNRIEVTTRYRQHITGPESRVDYDVSIPAEMSVTIRAQSGSIILSNLNGNLEVEGETAKMDLHNLDKAHANVRSLNGPISISNAKAVTMDVTCSSGNVDLNSVTGPTISVSTSSGPISYSGLINEAGEYNFITHSGDITLAMPAEASVDLIARSIRGTVENEFPLQQKPHLNFAPMQGRSFAGTSNSAASSVQLQTFSGKIRVKQQ